jgi:hypothetical protein
MSAAFPSKDALAGFRDEDGAEQDMATLLAVAKATRGLQMLQAMLISKPAGGDGAGAGTTGAVYEVQIRGADARNAELVKTHAADVAARCRIHDGLRVTSSSGDGVGAGASAGDAGMGWLSAAVGDTIVVRVGIPLDADVQAKVGQEAKRLTKKAEKLAKKKKKLMAQMGTDRYQHISPAAVKERDEGTVAGLDAEMDSIAATLQNLADVL